MGDEKKDFLNIFTDGSFCPNSGCSGYGICLEEGTTDYKKHKGRFSRTVRNSITAELIAVCMGVLHAHEVTEEFKGYKTVTVVSDAPGVREAFKRVSNSNRELLRLVQAAKRIMDLHQIRIRTIKGHQPKHSSKDAFFNHRCDVMAKREMRQWRDAEFPLQIDENTSRRRERRITRAKQKEELRKQVPSVW
jgi:ribonuclease HI